MASEIIAPDDASKPAISLKIDNIRFTAILFADTCIAICSFVFAFTFFINNTLRSEMKRF